MKKIFLWFCLSFQCFYSFSQNAPSPIDAWVDSVFNSLTPEQKIAQLMVVRMSSIDLKTRIVTFYDSSVEQAIRKYNIGGICLFQGGPVKQANLINHMQSIAQTPILISIDAETGLGMRMLDSVMALPRQMMLGAVQNPDIVYRYGKWVGQQCRREGIQVNYAPVVDVNNNPDNPVINDRSFGEDKFKVASYAIQYMNGLTDMGIMSCAKHFPGHGDVAVDSHYDLPLINKSKQQLDSLELYPFRELFKAGVPSVMVAHLSVPAIDNTANHPTSISYNAITKLMRDEMGYQGISFTDALDMKGIAKYYSAGEISAQSLIAGNDMLCLPGDIPGSIKKIKDAIRKKKLTWDDLNGRVKKVLRAKYKYGLANWKMVNTNNLWQDLNSNSAAVRREVSQNALTLLRNEDNLGFPIEPNKNAKIAFLGLGLKKDNAFAKRMRRDYNADVFLFDYNDDAARIPSLVQLLKTRYDAVVIGVHSYNRFPANNFGVSENAFQLLKQVQSETHASTFVFGNPYLIRNFCAAKNIVACYEDDPITQDVAADLVNGTLAARGKLPVTVCPEFRYGSGISMQLLPFGNPELIGIDTKKLSVIDSLANNAILNHATPGCVVLAVKDARIVYYKAFGYTTYDSSEATNLESIYDMASVTKVCATTISVMRLYDQGKLDIKKKLGYYLPWVRGTNKENLFLEDILLHQAGLKASTTYYRETIDTITGIPLKGFYEKNRSPEYSIRVADSMYERNDCVDSFYARILQGPLSANGQYVYSDNDFIFLGKVVEAVSGMTLDQYVEKEFYKPLGLTSIGFKPRDHFTLNRVAPTENEKSFRMQLLRGDVHDPGAAMFGGVAGHAGLFSDAYDLAVILQMLLDGGRFNGQYFFSPATVQFFSGYGSAISRRGFGFDKPEKDNDTRKEPYPCLSASPLTIGHTGFTGTCVWADPKYNLSFVFLSNRVCPDGGTNLKLSTLSVRGNIQEAVYQALIAK